MRHRSSILADTSRLLFLALICALASRTPSQGSEGAFSREIEEIANGTDDPDGVPWEGARLFAWRLKNHGIYLMTRDQLRQASFAHDILQAADEVSPQLKDADDRRARLTDAGQKVLLELLESMAEVQRITVKGAYASTNQDHRFHLAGNSGLLIFRIQSGDGPQTFLTTPWTNNALDLEAIPEPVSSIEVEYVPGGITWHLVKVVNSPPDGFAYFFDAKPRESDAPPARFLSRIEAGKMGNLALAVLNEDGVSIPALLSLRHISTDTLHRPSGALELAPQMSDIAGEPVPSPARPAPNPGQPFTHTIPGDEAGFYWLVAEDSNMALPEGEWEVRVWKGAEYLSQKQVFKISEGKTTVVSVKMKRWVNMSAKGWWSGDAHIHARLMSDQDAERLMTWMEASDLHVGNVVRMGNYLRTYFEQRGFGPDFRVQRGQRALVPGQEDPRFNQGHSLALNIDKPIRDQAQYLFTDWVARETAAAGGIYGNAHVQYNGFNIRRDMTMLMPQDLTHFGEVLQIGLLGTDLYYDFLNMGFKMAAVAGSDVPFGHAFGEVRYYVYTGSETLNIDAWFSAMRAGRTFVSNGPMIELTVNGEMPGAEIQVDSVTTLKVAAKANSAPVGPKSLKYLRVIAHGEVIEEIQPSEMTHSLRLDFDIPSGNGLWLTAEAASDDGSIALTSPIYVTRIGYRRWKYAAMPGLLDKADETLLGMELELKRAIEEYNNGEVPPWNLYARGLAQMGPEQLVRISKVREIYTELRHLHAIEAEMRQSPENEDVLDK